MPEQEPFISVKIGTDKDDTVFYNLEEVESWIQKEQEFWKWPDDMAKYQQHGFNFSHFFGRINSTLGQISNSVNAIKNNHDDNAHKNLVDKLRNLIHRTYKPYNSQEAQNRIFLLHSKDPRARYVHNLIETNPLRAACVATFFMHHQVDLNISVCLDGAVTAILFDLGFEGNVQAEKAALEQLRQEWMQKISDAQDTNQANKEDADKWRETTKADQETQQQEFKDFMEKNQTEIEEFKTLIKAEIALKGPVDYWRIKSREHRLRSKYYLKMATWAFGIVGVFLFLAILPFGDPIEKITLRHLGLIAIVATVGVWAIRLFVKNYLSNVHLFEDADERVAMMKTYLALIEEDKLEDKYRNLILQALFRPASTGIVKDDAAPPFMAEWLKQTTGNET